MPRGSGRLFVAAATLLACRCGTSSDPHGDSGTDAAAAADRTSPEADSEVDASFPLCCSLSCFDPGEQMSVTSVGPCGANATCNHDGTCTYIGTALTMCATGSVNPCLAAGDSARTRN